MIDIESKIISCREDTNDYRLCLTREEINEIKQALNKQEAQIPNYSGDGYYGGILVIDAWECPCCNTQYEVDYDDFEYCHKCGQHIDHSTLTEDD